MSHDIHVHKYALICMSYSLSLSVFGHIPSNESQFDIIPWYFSLLLCFVIYQHVPLIKNNDVCLFLLAQSLLLDFTWICFLASFINTCFSEIFKSALIVEILLRTMAFHIYKHCSTILNLSRLLKFIRMTRTTLQNCQMMLNDVNISVLKNSFSAIQSEPNIWASKISFR